MEMKTMVAIILIAVILVTMFIMLRPATETDDALESQVGFRQACLHWFFEGYSKDPTLIVSGKPIDMETQCEKELGISITTDENWQTCKNACQLKVDNDESSD